MMNADERAQKWLDSPTVSDDDKSAIRALKKKDPKAFEEAFYKDLAFGTGGLRGLMGLGTNRMNRYTVEMATQGLANYINQSEGTRSVAIAYDNRMNSRDFAQAAARVLTANDVTVYLFEELRPTPLLSFAIRQLDCQSGIVITASHNPKEYNGYKAYWNDGGQVIPPHDQNIIDEVRKIAAPEQVKTSGGQGQLHSIGADMDLAYLKMLKSLQLSDKATKDLSIVYSSIHGTGITMVPQALEAFGFHSTTVVQSQAEPDGAFPTVTYPNPEESAALSLALAQANQQQADLVMATDPDTDRVGIAIRNENNEMELLNGNQTGALLIYYLLKIQDLSTFKNPYIAKTIVTSDLIAEIAKSFDVACHETLTGFKYIAELIREKEGHAQYLAGGEESYGYLIGDRVRDKDAVAACVFLAEMAAWCGNKPYQLLLELYQQFGFYKESLISITREGREGATIIEKTMAALRIHPPKQLGGIDVALFKDYASQTSKNLKSGETQTINLPKSNVLQFLMTDGSKISVRPSGTEPKIKFYFSARTDLSTAEAYRFKEKELNRLLNSFKADITAPLL